MPFSITPKGAQAAPNAHAIDQQDIRAGRKPSARERALAAAHAQPPAQEAPKAPEPARESALKLTPDPVPQAQETPSASGQLQSTEASAAASPEASQAASKAPEPAKEPLSSQYAQLARKERALRAKAQELKQREDALKASQTPSQAPPATANGIPLEEFKKNPWKFMQEAGVSYDQVTRAALEAPTPEQQQWSQTVEELRSELRALKEEQTKTKTSWEDSQKTQYQQAVNQIKAEVTSLVSNDPEFETVKATNSIGDVVELIEKTFQEDGILLSVQDAAKQVEDYLAEEAYKLSQLSKVQKRFKPAPATVAAAPSKSPEVTPTQSQPSKTLTNAISGSRQMTARERALAAAIHGSNWREKI